MNKAVARRFTSAALFLACLLATAACALALHAREPDKTPTKLHPFEADIASFEKWDQKNSFPQDAVLFVGSSSIRLWKTAEAFPDLPVINRGFGGSTIAHVNYFFDRVVAKYKPRVIVLYSGDNDIAGGKSPKQVLDDFQEFVAAVHEKLPGTRVLVVAIKPSIARQKLWPKMNEANSLIAKLAENDDRLDFVDIATPMLDGKPLPPPSLFLKDGLHLNQQGYALWNETLKTPLQNALHGQ